MEGRELTVLPAIFQQLAAFNHNKAKDLAEKERSSVCNGGSAVSPLWAPFLACLAQFAAVERLYMNLNLLTIKGFLRRENSVRASYEGLLTDLTDLEVRAAGGATAPSNGGPSSVGQRPLSKAGALGAVGCVGANSRPDTSSYQQGVFSSGSEGNEGAAGPSAGGINALLWSLCSELLSFIRARICLIKFYEACHQGSNSSWQPLDYSDLAGSITGISSTYADTLTQPLLTALHANLKHECGVLHAVLQAMCSMQHHSFLSSLLHLSAAHDIMLAWQQLITCRESKKYSFGSSFLKVPSVPALFQWLWQVRAAATAKFSLYFYDSLAPQTSHHEMKALLARQQIDYVAKLVHFHRRVEASCVCLVLETSGLPDYKGPGYHLNQRSPSHPPSPSIPPPPPPPPSPFSGSSQVRSFRRIFSYPLLAMLSSGEAAQDSVCWSSLLHFLPKPLDQLPLAKDGVLKVYHHQSGYSHYLRAVEPLVTLVVSYDCHRTEKESAPVIDFLNEISQHLNLVKVFAALKPR